MRPIFLRLRRSGNGNGREAGLSLRDPLPARGRYYAAEAVARSALARFATSSSRFCGTT